MDLKNLTMSDLKEKLSGGALDKKTLIKFGIGLGAIILFLIIYYAILNPMVNEKKAIHEDKLLKQDEIEKAKLENVALQNALTGAIQQCDDFLNKLNNETSDEG